MRRNLFVILDFSENINQSDYPSGRLEFLKTYLTSFVRAFFDENTLSKLGMILLRDRRAYILSKLTCLYILSFVVDVIPH